MKLFLVVPFFFLILALPAWAQAPGPQPPCDEAAEPAYPAPGAPPAIAVWHHESLEQSAWRPPACTGWADGSGSAFVVAIAGSFRFDGTLSDLLTRAGAISAQPNLRYWSRTEKTWRPLVFDASALSAPDSQRRRPDFAASEIVEGARLHYWVRDSRFGEIVYSLSVRDRGAAQAAIAIENRTPVYFYFLALAQPGALQSVTFVERLSPGIWGIYLLSRVGQGTSSVAVGGEASMINRTVAIYRYLSGVSTDHEPPATP